MKCQSSPRYSKGDVFLCLGHEFAQLIAATIPPQKVEAARGNMKLNREATEEKIPWQFFVEAIFQGGLVENKQRLKHVSLLVFFF